MPIFTYQIQSHERADVKNTARVELGSEGEGNAVMHDTLITGLL